MLGRKRRKLTRDEFQYLNIMRMDAAYQTFTTAALKKKLAELGNGFWKDTRFLPFLVEYGILKKEGFNKYSFNDIPFSYEQLETAVHKYQCDRARTRIAHKKHNTTKVNVVIASNPIEEAINLLKVNGYRVQIKHFDVEKALQFPEKPVQDFITWTDC